MAEKIANNFVQGVGSTVISSTLQGEILSDGLEKALLAGLSSTIQAQLASNIKGLEDVDYLLHKIAHAAAGCATAAIQKQCEAGAIGAAVGEIAADLVPRIKPLSEMTEKEREDYNKKVLGVTQIIAGTVSAYAGYDANIAIQSANVAVSNNYLTDKEFAALKKELDNCKDNTCRNDKYIKYKAISDINDVRLQQVCTDIGSISCTQEINALIKGQNSAKNLGLSSQYITMNQFGKFSPFVQTKAEGIMGIEYLKNWEVKNCKGLSDAACGQKYLNLKTTEKEQLRQFVNAIEDIPVFGTTILVGENIKVIATGMDLTDSEKSRLLALTEVISLGVTKKLSHVLNPIGSSVHMKNPTEKISKNSDGFNEIKPTYTNRDAFDRLNTIDAGGNGRPKPAEAAAAAQLEPFLGKMERLPEKAINGQKQADGDFIITSGSNAGKKVDFIFTTKGGDQREINGINFKFEDKLKAMTADSNSTIPNHLKKADIIPVDYRILSPSNQAVFTNYLKTLSTKDQAKFLIMK